MDFKDYIESGKLDRYILGDCTPEEAQEAECMARIFPEVKQELESIRASLESYALSNQVQPPASLKQNIFSAIEKEEKKINGVPSKIISMAPSSRTAPAGMRVLLAACIALLLISIFITFNLVRKNNELATQIKDVQAKQNLSEQQFAELSNQFDLTKKQIQIMTDPHTMHVMMKGMPASPQSMAMIYWNKETKEVYLGVSSLPMPAVGKQYQLWGQVNGEMVDLGVFDMPDPSDSTIHPMHPVDNATAFAVTLEKAGGVPKPTVSAIVVMGNI